MATPKKATASKSVKLTSGKVAEDRVVLFSIDDEDYTVPAKPSLNVMLKFVDVARKSDNDMFALLELLECMLDAKGYQALLNYEGLTEEVLGQLVDICVELMQGKATELTKN